MVHEDRQQEADKGDRDHDPPHGELCSGQSHDLTSMGMPVESRSELMDFRPRASSQAERER